MFTGENREVPTWLQRAGLEQSSSRQWGGRPVPVLTAELVELAVES